MEAGKLLDAKVHSDFAKVHKQNGARRVKSDFGEGALLATRSLFGGSFARR